MITRHNPERPHPHLESGRRLPQVFQKSGGLVERQSVHDPVDHGLVSVTQHPNDCDADQRRVAAGFCIGIAAIPSERTLRCHIIWRGSGLRVLWATSRRAGTASNERSGPASQTFGWGGTTGFKARNHAQSARMVARIALAGLSRTIMRSTDIECVMFLSARCSSCIGCVRRPWPCTKRDRSPSSQHPVFGHLEGRWQSRKRW